MYSGAMAQADSLGLPLVRTDDSLASVRPGVVVVVEASAEWTEAVAEDLIGSVGEMRTVSGPMAPSDLAAIATALAVEDVLMLDGLSEVSAKTLEVGGVCCAFGVRMIQPRRWWHGGVSGSNCTLRTECVGFAFSFQH